MNQLDQLGTRINLICNVFDKWIGQQDLNYNLFAVLYTLAAARKSISAKSGACPNRPFQAYAKPLPDKG